MSSSASVISLVKRLAGLKWRNAFNILLHFDPNSTPTENSSENPFSGLADISNALLLVESTRLASRLQNLVADFGPDDEPVLRLLLLLMGKPLHQVDVKASLFPFESKHIDLPPSLPISPFPFETSLPGAFLLKSEDVNLDDLFVVPTESVSNAENEVRVGNRNRSVNHREEPVIVRQADSAQLTELEIMSDKGAPETSQTCVRLSAVVFKLLNSAESDDGHFDDSVCIDPRPRLRIRQDDVEMERMRCNYFTSYISCGRRNGYVVCVPSIPGNFALSRKNRFEEVMFARAQYCGQLYSALSCFSLAYLHAPGRVLAAVAEFAGNMAQKYHSRLSQELESDSSDTEARAWDVIHSAEEFLEDARVVVELLSRIERTSGSATAVLDLLAGSLSTHLFCAPVRELFYFAFDPYLELVLEWVFSASVKRDLGLEFFGTLLGSKATDDEDIFELAEVSELCSGRLDVAVFPSFIGREVALHILRSGRSRALLENLSPNHVVLGVRPETDIGCADVESFDRLAKLLAGCTAKMDDVNCAIGPLEYLRTDSANFCSSSRLPSESTREENDSHSCDFFCYPQLEVELVDREESFGFSVPGAMSRSIAETRDEALAETGPIHSPVTIFEALIVRNLRALDLRIQKQIMSYFVNELLVFDHLRVLGNFALLGAGDFANNLVDEVNEAEIVTRDDERFIARRRDAARTFYGSSEAGLASYRMQRHLAACFRAAYSSSSAAHCRFVDNLAVCVSGWGDSNDSLWRQTFEVEYEASFPLSMVISPASLSLYSKFFNFFLSVHRARKCLGSLYLLTRRMRSAIFPKDSSLNVKNRHVLSAMLWRFCLHGDHFVTIVGGYQFNQLHGIGRYEFETSWSSVSSVWELSDRHMSFLSNTLRTTLLAEKQAEVLRVINVAFRYIYSVEAKVCEVAEANALSPSKRHFADLSDHIRIASRRLEESAKFLVRVLEQLCASDSNKHLNDFLTRLNFNRFYDVNC